MERQSQALGERLLAGQEGFHGQVRVAYAELAAAVDRSLQSSLSASARAAGETIRPVVEATMAGIAREAAALHDGVAQAVERQLDGLSARVGTATQAAAADWRAALAEQRRTGQALGEDLRATLERFAATFEQRSATLLAEVSTRLERTTSGVSESWRHALAEQQRAGESLSRDTRQAWSEAAASFERHLASLLLAVDRGHAELQERLASGDAQRLAAWTGTLASTAASLRQEWQQAGEQALTAQQEICATLAQTARELTARMQAQQRDTIAEIERLVQAAAEAPRAAAEVIAELRQRLSDSMARDNAMLDERARLLATLGGLLDTVNHAATEQRAAIDALVASSAEVLERAGSRFTEKAEAEGGRMAAVAAQLTGSAAEVASLGEAFGFAVQLFGESSGQLMDHLQRLESALGQSLARSDEQLAYYVAQAREVIDLSLTSQKQIVEDLQQLADRRLALAGEA
jgi:hypothetical protein